MSEVNNEPEIVPRTANRPVTASARRNLDNVRAQARDPRTQQETSGRDLRPPNLTPNAERRAADRRNNFGFSDGKRYKYC